MYKNGQCCPICGEGKLDRVQKEKTLNYKGKLIKFESYEVFYCPSCEESLVPKTTIKKYEKQTRDFQRQVDGLLTSDEIKRMRKSLGFSQSAFASVLGVGEKNFARYENGTVTQSQSMDNLIRVIYEFPQALEVISKDKIRRQRVEHLGFYDPIIPSDSEAIYSIGEFKGVKNG